MNVLNLLLDHLTQTDRERGGGRGVTTFKARGGFFGCVLPEVLDYIADLMMSRPGGGEG